MLSLEDHNQKSLLTYNNVWYFDTVEVLREKKTYVEEIYPTSPIYFASLI